MTNQNDFVIDNGTGFAVRQDIQDALQALAGNSSGNSEPSVKYAYQWWADTNANVMKLRNSGNTAWIELFQLDGTLTLEDGTATDPALAFRDDLNTGIYSGAPDTFNVATGGVARLEISTSAVTFNESGANVDFRIEGDTDANLFFVDAGNNKIGIGSNAPSSRFSIIDTTTFTAYASTVPSASQCMLQLFNNPSSEAINNHATLQFGVNGGTHNRIATISAVAESAGNRKLALAFCTDKGSNRNERMRLTGDGQLGIGIIPSRMLHIKSDGLNKSHIALVDFGTTNEVFRVGQQSDGDGFLQVLDDSGQAQVALEASGDSFFSGDLGVGTSSLSARLHVSGGTGLLVERSAGTSIAGFKHSGSNTMNIYFQNTGSTNHPSIGSEDQTLTIGTNNSNRIKVNNAGDTIILAVNVYEGGRSLDINSTSTWSTFFTFSNSQANAFVARFTATENNNSTGYIVMGSVVGNQITQSFMTETNHAHSKDVLFQLAGTGNTQLQVKANSFTTTRRVRLIDIFVSAGRPTYA